MSGWAGFSDEDLRRLKQKTDSIDEFPRLSYKPGNEAKVKPAMASRSKPIVRDKMASLGRNIPSTGNTEAINPDQMLSKPKPTKPRSNTKEKLQKNKESNSLENGKLPVEEKEKPTKPEIVHSDGKDEPTNKEVITEELDEQEGISRELMSLDKFRDKQKEIEEANKMKQKMLYSAIQERQKRTKAEAVKLVQIQKELALLDKITTDDVSVIRDKIEDVSREFMDAQRRYDRAEKEFVEAKIELQKKLEVKENLTDHLYTIIQQNEMRKSRKLAELMKKLEMEAAADVASEPEILPVPQLTLLTTGQPDPFHHHPQKPASPTTDNTEKVTSQNAAGDGSSEVTAQSVSPASGASPPSVSGEGNVGVGEAPTTQTADSDRSDVKSTPGGSTETTSAAGTGESSVSQQTSSEPADNVEHIENPPADTATT